MAVGDLVDRIFGDAEPKIKVHLFGSGVRELFDSSGFATVTAGQLNSFVNPDNDATNLAWLQQINVHITAGNYSVQHFIDALILAEKRVPGYSTPAEIKARLGIV
jgi:hypothetical protein